MILYTAEAATQMALDAIQILGWYMIDTFITACKWHIYTNTPQPLYNTIIGVQANVRVSYPNRVITSKMYRNIAKII